MCFNFMISMAAKCSDVCGCGHDSLPAKEKCSKNYMSQYFYSILHELVTIDQHFLPINNKAASMTAAPFNIVAIRIS